MRIKIAVLATLIFNSWVGIAFSQVSRDAKGWTVVTPSADTRIVYVSSTLGNDAWDGLSPALGDNGHGPKKTFASAQKLLRPGYPDWLLLKSGDSWAERLGGQVGGRSADEPMLFSSYQADPSNPQTRPILMPDGSGQSTFAENYTPSLCAYMCIIGLDFYDPVTDSNSSQFDPSQLHVNRGDAGIRWLDNGKSLLVEDCRFRFQPIGIYLEYYNHASPQDITLRRNLFTNLNSFGLLMAGINGLTVEENIFYHNGYNVPFGIPGNIFNHDLYFTGPHMTNLTIARNMFLAPSSLSCKIQSYDNLPDTFSGALIENNLYFEGEVGIGMGTRVLDAKGNTLALTSSLVSFRNFTIRHNVLLQTNRDNPTGRGLGWAMLIANVADTVVSDNIFTDLSFCGNSFAVMVASADDSTPGNSDYFVTSNLTLRNNLVYRVHDQAFFFKPRPLWSNLTVTGNTVVDPDLGASMLTQYGPFTSQVFSNNVYSPSQSNPGNFANVAPTIAGNNIARQTFAQWVTASGETGSQLQSVSYPDPHRNLETYQATLGGGSLNDFITQSQAQQRVGWDARTPTQYWDWNWNYSAAAVNDYIRAGFAIAPLGGYATPTANYNLNAKKIIAFPNPAREKVSFLWPDLNVSSARANIYNIAGERVATLKVKNPQQLISWNLQGVGIGIYLCQVVLTVNGVEIKKPVVKIAVVR